MSAALTLVLSGVALAVAGHYRAKVAALEQNPITRVRIVPRTMFEDSMGVNWVSESQ